MATETGVDTLELEVNDASEAQVETEASSEEPKEKRERKQYNVSPELFVKTWQESNSADEVSEKLSMPKNIVLARSAVYRKNRKDGSPGVPLKKMPRVNPRRLDVDNLRKLAEESAPAKPAATEPAAE